jgi:hypothetical protein
MNHLDDSPAGALRPRESVVVITGNYGSGKTEVAVNWALWLRRAGLEVTIADLDIVNPYFRCREATAPMEAEGIRVIAPTGEMHHAELPIILPEIRGAIERPRGVTVLDVGGDPVGARVLSGLAGYFGRYEMVQVVNQRRPFTDTVEGCLKLQREIEEASRLRVTGLVSNAHLMDETDEAVILDGEAFAREVGRARGQELRFVTVERRLLEQVDLDRVESPVMVLDRLMLPPWKRPATGPIGAQGKIGSANFKLRLTAG